MKKLRRVNKRLSLIGTALLLAGCLNVGPNTIVQDRFKYNQAIRDSWEEQMLNNSFIGDDSLQVARQPSGLSGRRLPTCRWKARILPSIC